MILALETATNVCSVAFYDGSDIYERRIAQRGSHSEKLFLFLEKLQEEHGFKIPDLDAVLVSEGPGSYTGLRIGASAVKGLLFQTDVPLYAVNTLGSFAFRAAQDSLGSNYIHAIIDARRVHLYHQKFVWQNGQLHADKEVEIIPIQDFEAIIEEGDYIIGTGLNRINEEALQKAKCYGPGAISAKSLISLYNSSQIDFYSLADAESFDPKYYTSNQAQ